MERNPLRGFLLLLGGAALLPVGCSGSSLHSQSFAFAYVSDPGQFYHVAYVDEQPYVSYDVATRRVVPQAAWMEELGKDYPTYWEIASFGAREWEVEFRVALAMLLNLYNQSSSAGLHTLQARGGCEEQADRRPAVEYAEVAYDGEDFGSFDMEHITWTGNLHQALEFRKRWESMIPAWMVKEHLEDDCVVWLRRYLRYGNETLQRRVPPTVKVARKVYQDGQETLFCQAHGFYPKEIEVIWMKDGVQQKDTLTGGVVPNSDGTYHKWLSIDVDPKDRDHYRCQVAHDGLQEPLDLAWEEPANVGLIVGVLAGVLLAAALVGGVIYYMTFYMRRGQRGCHQECLGVRGYLQRVSAAINSHFRAT